MGYCGEFSGVGSWVRSDLVGLGRLYEICLNADRQLDLMPVGLLATILPYPIFRLLFSSGKGKVEPRYTGNQYYQCHFIIGPYRDAMGSVIVLVECY